VNRLQDLKFSMAIEHSNFERDSWNGSNTEKKIGKHKKRPSTAKARFDLNKRYEETSREFYLPNTGSNTNLQYFL